MDVLNTMLNADLPLTPPEWPEWGNPIEDKAAFEYIRSYSPYDQLMPGEYPPIMVTAGLNDTRVTYWEPAKYVAKLRAVKMDDNLVLLKTDMGSGHGGRSGRTTRCTKLPRNMLSCWPAWGWRSSRSPVQPGFPRVRSMTTGRKSAR